MQGGGGGMLRQFLSHLDLGMQETRVWSLGREDPLEKEVATYSSILAEKFRELRSLVRYSPWGR